MGSSKRGDIRIVENAVGEEISKTEVDMNDHWVDGNKERGKEVGDSVCDEARSSRDPHSILLNASPTRMRTESNCKQKWKAFKFELRIEDSCPVTSRPPSTRDTILPVLRDES